MCVFVGIITELVFYFDLMQYVWVVFREKVKYVTGVSRALYHHIVLIFNRPSSTFKKTVCFESIHYDFDQKNLLSLRK